MLQVRPEVYAFLVEPELVPDIKRVGSKVIFQNTRTATFQVRRASTR
jgi:hypothetical protein